MRARSLVHFVLASTNANASRADQQKRNIYIILYSLFTFCFCIFSLRLLLPISPDLSLSPWSAPFLFLSFSRSTARFWPFFLFVYDSEIIPSDVSCSFVGYFFVDCHSMLDELESLRFCFVSLLLSFYFLDAKLSTKHFLLVLSVCTHFIEMNYLNSRLRGTLTSHTGPWNDRESSQI